MSSLKTVQKPTDSKLLCYCTSGCSFGWLKSHLLVFTGLFAKRLKVKTSEVPVAILRIFTRFSHFSQHQRSALIAGPILCLQTRRPILSISERQCRINWCYLALLDVTVWASFLSYIWKVLWEGWLQRLILNPAGL